MQKKKTDGDKREEGRKEEDRKSRQRETQGEQKAENEIKRLREMNKEMCVFYTL